MGVNFPVFAFKYHPIYACSCAKNGASALLMASEQGHLNIVKILLQHNARVDVFDEVSGVGFQ